MRWRLRPGIPPDAAIPTSSMADIAFLLLVFFMVTTVFSATKGLELTLPRDDSARDREPVEAVYVHVVPGGLEVDCRKVGLDGLVPYLEPILTRNPSKPVVVVTDPEASYRDLVAVYDRLCGTRAPGSAFAVGELSIPTRREIEAYVAAFGVDPFESACR